MTAPTVAGMIHAAVAQRGIRETPVNRTPFARALDNAYGPVTLSGGTQVWRDGIEWCAVFMAWAWWEASGETELPPLGDGGFYTPADLQAWDAQGAVVDGARPGDWIYYTNAAGTPHHVGLVVNVRGGQVDTIEGNTSPATVVNPNGGGVFLFAVGGDAPPRILGSETVLVRPSYAAPSGATDNEGDEPVSLLRKNGHNAVWMAIGGHRVWIADEQTANNFRAALGPDLILDESVAVNQIGPAVPAPGVDPGDV